MGPSPSSSASVFDAVRTSPSVAVPLIVTKPVGSSLTGNTVTTIRADVVVRVLVSAPSALTSADVTENVSVKVPSYSAGTLIESPVNAGPGFEINQAPDGLSGSGFPVENVLPAGNPVTRTVTSVSELSPTSAEKLRGMGSPP